MKPFLFCFLFISATLSLSAQLISKMITTREVQRIETALSADEMQGRKTFTAGNDRAASFINNEFKKIGLKTFNNTVGYSQPFTLIQPKTINVAASFSGQLVDSNNIIVFSTQANVNVTEKSGFKIVHIKQGAAFGKEVSELIALQQNLLVFIDNSFEPNFRRLAKRNQYLFKSDKSTVFILGNFDTANFKIEAGQSIVENHAANVIGMLPGKSKKDEFVIFSAHYDHLGTDKPVNNDSIYNGANDDASGVTAVISLAKYYKAANINERTLIFVAFTGEEIGGYGSQYFSNQINPKKAVAMFNIEMIGTESKWGKNSAYITGFEKTDMGSILQKNLHGTGFTFHPDPYTAENLFYRSDNATLARLGVAAHTISTSKMDNEPNYHKFSDEVKTLDLKNMAAIIQSIAISAKSIIITKDTPTRVE